MALKKVGRVKSLGLNGLSYEIDLRLSPKCVSILTVVFNKKMIDLNWSRQRNARFCFFPRVEVFLKLYYPSDMHISLKKKIIKHFLTKESIWI